MPPKRKAKKADETAIDRKAREALQLATKTLKRQGSLDNLFGKTEKKVERSELEAIFRIYDKDGDGHITSTELAAVLRGMGKRPYSQRIQLMLEEIDTDQNGTIELDEWVTYMERQAANEAKDVTEREYIPEAIRASRLNPMGTREVFIKWLGYPEEANTWEPAANFDQADLDEFDANPPMANTPQKKQKPKKTAKKAAVVKPKRGKRKIDDDDDDDGGDDDDDKKDDSSSSPAAGAGAGAGAPGAAPYSLKKNASIIAFYNANAALQHIDGASVDKHDNPEGKENDLGIDGAFVNFELLVGLFTDIPRFAETVQKALQSKGFEVIVTNDEKEFTQKIKSCDLAWIVSGQNFDTSKISRHDFATAVESHHKGGGGLFLWADAQHNEHASMLTDLIFGGKLEASAAGAAGAGAGAAGGTTLSVADDAKDLGAHQIRPHLVSTGLAHLAEGSGNCVFVGGIVPAALQVLAKSSDNQGLIFTGTGVEDKGRTVVDLALSKLNTCWDAAGTERYVKNVSVWLLGLDHRIASDLPLRGKKKKDPNAAKWVWQYNHGPNWHNYDTVASDLVEAIYLDYLKNPMVDVRSVKSGSWHYMVDFTNMEQQNIEHHARKKRNIRRVWQDKSNMDSA